MVDKESKIRKRAYELWEAEGRPDNRHHHHWEQATQELEKGPVEKAGKGSAKKADKPVPQDAPAAKGKSKAEPTKTSSGKATGRPKAKTRGAASK
ncbi:hypothetical protein FHS85_003231 [Rhodoligotrophos appendicifer]|uniref:DUF2934 domain-containing protein n=1 Tax=Rhodoligotrophos appendicifer TaxID=987056 RepID=UPI0011867F56|nr:DUF2934 domain-containing protein [Rhodoligotrophos appendicifer]